MTKYSGSTQKYEDDGRGDDEKYRRYEQTADDVSRYEPVHVDIKDIVIQYATA